MAISGWVSQLPAGAEGGGSLSLKFIFRVSFVEDKLTKKKRNYDNNNIGWQRRSKKWRSWSLACRPSLPCHGASWAESVDLSRGSLEREKSCLFRRVGGVQRKV